MPDINSMFLDYRRIKPSITQPELLRSLLNSMVSTYYDGDPKLSFALGLLDYLFDGKDVGFDTSALNVEDFAYTANMLKIRSFVQAGQFIANHNERISLAPMTNDFISKQSPEWPILKFMNFALLLSLVPSKRAAVVTSIRNEGISILEWVAHYRSLGFDEIFVYTNNNTDGSDPLLDKLAHNNIIRLIRNTVAANVAPQAKAYEHSLHLLPELREYRWVFYIDADEFFIPRCGQNLDMDDFFYQFDLHFRGSFPAAISFNWKWFGSENALERTEGLLLRRFVHSIHNEHVKTLARLDCILTMRPVHCPVMFKDCLAVDSEFNPLTPVSMKTSPVYGFGQINHYWNKSFHEFVMKKFRGRGAVGTDGTQRDFSMFFDWGANDRRGNYDPQPAIVVERTDAALQQLLELPGVAEDLENINQMTHASIAAIDTELNLKKIYERRGLLEG